MLTGHVRLDLKYNPLLAGWTKSTFLLIRNLYILICFVISIVLVKVMEFILNRYLMELKCGMVLLAGWTYIIVTLTRTQGVGADAPSHLFVLKISFVDC
jgi:hypothetical protein